MINSLVSGVDIQRAMWSCLEDSIGSRSYTDPPPSSPSITFTPAPKAYPGWPPG
ncbi:MAG: hypothetical protein AB1414_09225 [bacterium]